MISLCFILGPGAMIGFTVYYLVCAAREKAKKRKELENIVRIQQEVAAEEAAQAEIDRRRQR